MHQRLERGEYALTLDKTVKDIITMHHEYSCESNEFAPDSLLIARDKMKALTENGKNNARELFHLLLRWQLKRQTGYLTS